MNILVPSIHSHRSCMRRQEEILSPKAGWGQPLLWLHVQRSSNQNLGCGLEAPCNELVAVCSGTTSGPYLKELNYGLWAARRAPAISWGKQNFGGKENPKEIWWAEEEHQDQKEQLPGLVWIHWKGQGARSSFRKSQAQKSKIVFLPLRTSKKSICCPSPSQTKPTTRSRKQFQKLYVHLGAITSI